MDPSYITALVDDLDQRGLARREPAPDDRRVKIIVLTDEGPQARPRDRRRPLGASGGLQGAVVGRELRELRDLLDKILVATPDAGASPATKVAATAAS